MSPSKDFSVEMPFGPPPLLSDIKNELKEFIQCPEKLPIHQLDNAQCYFPRKPNIKDLLNFDLSPIGSTIKFERDLITGHIGNMYEINLSSTGQTARNSMSMSRAPGPPTEGVRGNSSNFLFWPGGFDEPEINEYDLSTNIDFEHNLRTLAKGFKAGLEFKSDNRTPKSIESEEDEDKVNEKKHSENEMDTINLMAVIHEEGKLFDIWSKNMQSKNKTEVTKEKKIEIDLPTIDDNIMQLSDEPEIPILNTSKSFSGNIQTEWAEQLDVAIPVTDFNKKIPDPALTFPYELDNFQKQAILKLEENCNVFVAAHTSAGKTTVAEYAIALSQKHMTRTIYTSPIKALSNQKFREFKEKFESVGLITGDIQINQTAHCLIMTTEILQSMLYCASEVIRDLEYVIFDEVHYINNEDRGHVWEEIVILLPPTVSIVMLSATVPNPLHFANWVGQIKQRKMYVISTVKRPVPLQHFLYTGIELQNQNDCFLVVDTDGRFINQAWINASKSKARTLDQEKKLPGKRKLEPINQKNPKTERSLWMTLLNYLKREDKLPVVIFALSRNRCDSTAKMIKQSLITQEQQREVEEFFKASIKKLKNSDANLPQVNMIKGLLKLGIGIHHSGILPILKEIVELLFQKGLVKMLFATETFAMGVNMPARTVVFDSIKKYDGNNFRMLHPTEYIQMAGRAGRRGHDPIGTVMIFCKKDVPTSNELLAMMCGKPQSLQSRFKVTYSMVLHLRRLSETISVEDMMRRSFREAGTQKSQKQCILDLERVEKEISKIKILTSDQQFLSDFYDNASEYLKIWKKMRPEMLWKKGAMKHLKEERVLIITHKHHVNKLGLLLSISQQTTYKVLVLNNTVMNDIADTENAEEKKSDIWYNMLALVNEDIFVPEGIPSHEILLITANSIKEITNSTIKTEVRRVIADWDNRQIPRFKNAPPGAACQAAISELMRMSLEANKNPEILKPFVNINIENESLVNEFKYMMVLKKNIKSNKDLRVSNFIEKFEPVFNLKQLEKKKEMLKQTLSGESLEDYAEYKCRVEILKDLGYIDQDERVTLKGRVALEMGTHELLLTELVLKNILTDWNPAEIAALLSALVFQRKSNDKDEPEEKDNSRLKQLEKIVQAEFNILNAIEEQFMLTGSPKLSFELVPVVYKWARQESFASIMEYTDIQEGIIVRCIQQLNETLRDVKNAAIIIGNPVLKTKMEQASTAIKRDIVFTASLYTQD